MSEQCLNGEIRTYFDHTSDPRCPKIIELDEKILLQSEDAGKRPRLLGMKRRSYERLVELQTEREAMIRAIRAGSCQGPRVEFVDSFAVKIGDRQSVYMTPVTICNLATESEQIKTEEDEQINESITRGN